MVNGVVEWKLFGFTLFTEIKEYKGIAKLNKILISKRKQV